MVICPETHFKNRSCDMGFSVDDSPAVVALGPLFKLTEVHLWDDGSSDARELAYFQEPVKLTDGDGKDCEKRNLGRINGFSMIPEDVELARELSDLGLPLSFHTNKEMRYGGSNGKKKGTRNKNQQSHTETDGFMAIEEENRFHTSLIDDTSKILDQSEILKKSTVEEIDGPSNISLECRDLVSSTVCTSTLTNEHECNGEMPSSLEFECGNSEGSFLINEIEEEPNTLLVMDHETEGQLNGASVEVIEELHVQFSEQANSNMVAYWDDFYKRTYFYNVETGVSTWDPPPGMEHLVCGDMADEKTSKLDEVQASCDVQPRNSLAQEIGNEDGSLSSQQVDVIMGNVLSADNINITIKRKKHARRTNINSC